jgi:hypothetical protein
MHARNEKFNRRKLFRNWALLGGVLEFRIGTTVGFCNYIMNLQVI